MKIEEFLKENNLSIGDNIIFLFEKLNIDKEILKKVEAEIGESAKMSKSKANTVDPEEAIKEYGADTVRLYILFTAPPENDFEWSEEGIKGAYRFLNRLWDLVWKYKDKLKFVDYSKEDFKNLGEKAKNIRRKIHSSIKRYKNDIEKNYQFNTAIASIMELFNELSDFNPSDEKELKVFKEGIEALLLMLAPITPHICEELWNLIGKNSYIVNERLPEVDEDALVQEEFEIGVQINGKLRGRIKIKSDDSEDEILNKIKLDEKLKRYIDGKDIKKIVYIKNKLVNLVVS